MLEDFGEETYDMCDDTHVSDVGRMVHEFAELLGREVDHDE